MELRRMYRDVRENEFFTAINNPLRIGTRGGNS